VTTAGRSGADIRNRPLPAAIYALAGTLAAFMSGCFHTPK